MSWYFERGRVTGKKLLCHHCPDCHVLHKDVKRGVWHCGKYERVPWLKFFIPTRGAAQQQPRFVALGDWFID